MSEPLSERARQRLLAMAAEEHVQAPLPPRYEIVRELGRGGMGIVHEAIDHHLGRRCAVKTFAVGVGATDELRQRLAREAQAAARLRHPHIAAVYDATADHISMQLIDGVPIDAVHRDERRLLVELVRDAAHALQHAHEQGVVHRDVKPSNLLVEGRHVYVVDFGLAKEIAADRSQSLPGGLVGTPAFMAPEQARGNSDRIDARSDVYGLGATLFACLRGAPPFAAADLPALLQQVIDRDAPRLGVDRDLDLVVQKCLAKEPAQRYQGAGDLAADLERWLRHEPVHARRPSLGYRLQKRLQRQRSLWRAAAVAAFAAAAVVTLVLVPPMLRESAARAAASEAVELADQAATVVRDAEVFYRLGDNASAQQLLDQGIDRTRAFLARHEVPRARYLLSRLLRARGQPDEALAEAERALAAEPDLVDARFERGLLLATRPQLDEAARAMAIDDLTVATGERSVLTAIDRLLGRGELLRLRGDDAAAMAILRELLDYDPTHVQARVALARAALALGQTDLARYYSASAYDFAHGFGPVYLAQEQQALPTAMLGLDGALLDYTAALRDTPRNALAMAHRGLVQLRRALRLEADGDLVGALAALEAAIDDHGAVLTMQDDVAGARNNRAVCRLVAERLRARSGDTAGAVAERQQAEADLRRAISIDATAPEVPFNLGLCAQRDAEVQRRLGRDAAVRAGEARQCFERAQRLAPPDWAHAAACRAHLDAVTELLATAR